jgi:membrane protein
MNLPPRFERWKRAMWSASWALFSGEMSLVAAGCAFYATLALFPALTTLISLYGLVFNPLSVEPQLVYLRNFMPPAAFQLIAARIQQTVSQGNASLGIGLAISLIFTLYSAASGTKSLIYALNVIHKKEDSRSIIKFQLVTLGMTLLAILGSILAIGVLVVLPLIFTFFGFGTDSSTMALVLGFILLLGFMGFALSLLYRYGPAFKRPPREGGHNIVPGASVAVVFWLLLSYLFAVYVGQFAAYSRTYGPLATIIGLMMWFYLTAYTILFGALLNASLDNEARATMPHQIVAPAP